MVGGVTKTLSRPHDDPGSTPGRSGVEREPRVETGDAELVRWTLSLTLEERLAALQDFVDAFWTPPHG